MCSGDEHTTILMGLTTSFLKRRHSSSEVGLGDEGDGGVGVVVGCW